MTWPAPVETSGQLKQSGQVTLDATGSGTVYLQPTSAHQRWEVAGVTVSTNQAANAVVIPLAQIALNSNDVETMSAGNQRGGTYSGNMDTASGQIDVGPCDFLGVLFSPPPGSTPDQVAQLVGVVASAVVTGTKYTRVA